MLFAQLWQPCIMHKTLFSRNSKPICSNCKSANSLGLFSFPFFHLAGADGGAVDEAQVQVRLWQLKIRRLHMQAHC